MCVCVNVQPQSACVWASVVYVSRILCVCVLYSQCPQFGHVVEAGQGDEGDVVVVEGAGQRNSERKKGRKEKNRLLDKEDPGATYWSGGFNCDASQIKFYPESRFKSLSPFLTENKGGEKKPQISKFGDFCFSHT